MALFERKLSDATQDILKQSIDFESNVISQVKRSERRAWTVALCAMGVTVCLVMAIAYMLPLKEKVPYLVTVDLRRSTSTVTHLRDDVAYTGIYASEALNRSYVAQFVQAREGYDWDTINEHEWEVVAAMSNESIRNLFVRQFDGSAQSPEKRWGRNAAIRVKVNSIVFHGLDEEGRRAPTGATVRFEKWRFDKSNGNSEYLSSHVGTLNYEFKTHLKMNSNLRLRNPLGFQVTAYRVDDEFNAPVFKSTEMQGGIPLLDTEEGVSFRAAETAVSPQTPVSPAVLPGAPPLPSSE
jgi:type IV secretion system protein VirB8